MRTKFKWLSICASALALLSLHSQAKHPVHADTVPNTNITRQDKYQSVIRVASGDEAKGQFSQAEAIRYDVTQAKNNDPKYTSIINFLNRLMSGINSRKDAQGYRQDVQVVNVVCTNLEQMTGAKYNALNSLASLDNQNNNKVGKEISYATQKARENDPLYTNVANQFNSILASASVQGSSIYDQDVNVVNNYYHNLSNLYPRINLNSLAPVSLNPNAKKLSLDAYNYYLRIANNYYNQATTTKDILESNHFFAKANIISHSLALMNEGDSRLTNQYNNLYSEYQRGLVGNYDFYKAIPRYYNVKFDRKQELIKQKIHEEKVNELKAIETGDYAKASMYHMCHVFDHYHSNGIPFTNYYKYWDIKAKPYQTVANLAKGKNQLMYDYDSSRVKSIREQEFAKSKEDINTKNVIRNITNQMREPLAINQKAEAFRTEMIKSVNNARVQYGLKPLKFSTELQKIAEKRIAYATYAYDHYNNYIYLPSSPNESLNNRIDSWIHGIEIRRGIEDYIPNNIYGENVGSAYSEPDMSYKATPDISYDTTTPNKAADATNDWMLNHDQSQGNVHRENILDLDFNSYGVSARYNPKNKEYYFVQNFTYEPNQSNGMQSSKASATKQPQRQFHSNTPTPQHGARFVAKPISQATFQSNRLNTQNKQIRNNKTTQSQSKNLIKLP